MPWSVAHVAANMYDMHLLLNFGHFNHNSCFTGTPGKKKNKKTPKTNQVEIEGCSLQCKLGADTSWHCCITQSIFTTVVGSISDSAHLENCQDSLGENFTNFTTCSHWLSANFFLLFHRGYGDLYHIGEKNSTKMFQGGWACEIFGSMVLGIRHMDEVTALSLFYKKIDVHQ